MNIPEEAIEAAAKASYFDYDDGTPKSWTEETQSYRDAWVKDARVALEAAAPALMAQAWDEGREFLACQMGDVMTDHDANPYRTEALHG